jgi:hypothetical protein
VRWKRTVITARAMQPEHKISEGTGEEISMDAATVESIKLAAQVTSTLVAVVAVVIGLRIETRNQRRFAEQLSQSRKVAQAAARPMISVESEGYENEKAVTLVNHGPGTAIVTKLTIERSGRHAKDIVELLDVKEKADIVWNENTTYETPYYMAGKSSEDAFRIKAERLIENKIPAKRVQPLLDEIDNQLEEIVISIEYEDVFGERFRDTG